RAPRRPLAGAPVVAPLQRADPPASALHALPRRDPEALNRRLRGLDVYSRRTYEMGRFDAAYARLPVPLQHATVTAYGAYWHWLRFGPGYARFVRGFEERERFGADEWRRWTEQRLRQLLTGALEAPYYAQAWGTTERAAARAGRLEDLPLLEKQPIRADPRAFLRPLRG